VSDRFIIACVSFHKGMSSAQWSGACSFFDCLLEMVSYLDSVDADPHTDKGDVIDGVRSRTYFMVGKMLSFGVCTSMSLQGWDAVERDPPTLEGKVARPRPERVAVIEAEPVRTLPSMPTPWRRKALDQANLAAMRLGAGRIKK